MVLNKKPVWLPYDLYTATGINVGQFRQVSAPETE